MDYYVVIHILNRDDQIDPAPAKFKDFRFQNSDVHAPMRHAERRSSQLMLRQWHENTPMKRN